MEDSITQWLTAASAMLCSAAAGLMFSFSIPAWQEDESRERMMSGGRWLQYHGAGGYGPAALAWLLGVIATPTRAGLLSLAFLAAALTLGWNAWPPEMLMQGVNDGSAESRDTFLFMLLLEPGLWVVLLAGITGYVAGHVWQERAVPRSRPRTDFDSF